MRFIARRLSYNVKVRMQQMTGYPSIAAPFHFTSIGSIDRTYQHTYNANLDQRLASTSSFYSDLTFLFFLFRNFFFKYFLNVQFFT
ncbi:hypothetical protein PUN28_002720 [Cardiocondyla obscurior]|uniref:Uncharacterized protein n=1 Tax=Cardiocondyla obscurior TaxID=286306 RepID=A0AAW2GVQ8_9HYME